MSRVDGGRMSLWMSNLGSQEKGQKPMAVPLVKLDEHRYEIPKEYKPGMRVPGLVYASGRLLQEILKDDCLDQVANGATLPGIVTASIAMPDIHFGYGLPIGGVVATDPQRDGVVSPGGVSVY